MSQKTLAEAPQTHIYTAADGNIEIMAVDNEIWLSQKDMARVFGVTPQMIGQHVKSVMEDDKLDDSTIKESFLVAADGKTRKVRQYNLSVVLPVGYRVNSQKASDFRAWANGIIESYLTIGIVINQPLLESKGILKMQNDVNKHERAGLGDAPQIVHLKSELEVKRSLKAMNELLDSLIDNPEYWRIHDAKHLALFGYTSKQIKAMMDTKDIHKSLPAMQLDNIDFAHKQIIQILRMQGNTVDNQRVIEAIAIVVEPLGVYLKSVCDRLGIHHVTGKSLLPSGKSK